MMTGGSGQREKSKGGSGQWFPRLLTWGGLLLIAIGGITALPALRDYLFPQDAQSKEFVVTLTPVAVAAEPSATVIFNPPVFSTKAPAAPQAQAMVTLGPSPTPQLEALQATATDTLTPLPTSTPLPTMTPTPTPDPASLIPTRLLIPAIGLDAPVVEIGWDAGEVNDAQVSVWNVPKYFAAGWHKTSAPPGRVGNTVLNGHHNIHGEVFRDLIKLKAGDQIFLYVGATEYAYSVTELHLLEEKGRPVEERMQNAQWIAETEDERLTLVTCWPYTNNTHRLVIVALPTQPTSATME
jgi:sortase A